MKPTLSSTWEDDSLNESLINLAKKLWPICRSLTGDGVRETLKILKEVSPSINVSSYKSGTRVFDWEIPPEWNISGGWIKDESGKEVINFQNNNLHVVGYSNPIQGWLDREELSKRIHTCKSDPDAIPYVTSYYSKDWGFCMSENLFKSLKGAKYEVSIKSSFNPKGVMNYGEAYIKGKSSKEILISTYICHPSMANNEISGPVVCAHLLSWIKQLGRTEHSYRFLFVPETIGSIAYLAHNYKKLKKKVIAGFNVTCIGDERSYSYLPSRGGHTLSDRVAKHVFSYIDKNYKTYTWLDRGSDERQYCAPGIDLPVCSVMRSKYGEYPEYHTSKDNFDLVTDKGLSGGLKALKMMILVLESNFIPTSTYLCEPRLGKRKLCRTDKTMELGSDLRNMENILTYCDGSIDLIEITEKIGISYIEAEKAINLLLKHKLISKIN